MSRTTALVCIAFGWIAGTGPAGQADEVDPATILTNEGLKKVGSYWILPGEQELQQRLKSLAPKQHELDEALKLRERYEQDRAQKRVALQNAMTERRRLNYLARQAEDRRDYSRAMQRLSALSDQIDLMARYVNDSGPADQINRQVGAAGDALYSELHGLRELVDSVQARYAELAEDAKVAAAMDALAKESGRKAHLGPRRVFARGVEELEDFEAAIRSEEIKLREDHGVFWIDVTLNGTARVEMVFDTGASLISLPQDVAERAKIEITDADPVIQMRVADGRAVEGRLVFLKEVQVGEFTVQNVEAVISPGDAPPLLGGSFLQNFSIDLNHAAGTLRLTSVANPEPSGRSRHRVR
ncbi:MAG TPA: TIGR02281 family clan AA aspartic protease [Phycisphaerae bacterium]|nr:TIGR02281 family clan AA aspartic protease [Phycisphaerales bacterium]HRX86246.1 TIGR02281 family clan AA aspartic protease [Phycisphaerae bacterium]